MTLPRLDVWQILLAYSLLAAAVGLTGRLYRAWYDGATRRDRT